MDKKVEKLFDLIVGDDLQEGRPPMSDERKRELKRRQRLRILKTKERIKRDQEKSNYNRNRLTKLLTKQF